VHQNLIDHHLAEQRRHQGDKLNENRDEKHFCKNAFEAMDDRKKPRHAEARRLRSQTIAAGHKENRA
jgi:hypothetical protein